MAAVMSTSSPSVITYHRSWKSSGRALRTISCERCFIDGHCSDIQPVLLLSSLTLPSPTFLPLSSSWMSQDRLPSTADTGKIQIIAFNPPKKDGVSRGQGLLQRVGWLCVLRAALSTTHTHLHDNPHPAPQKLHYNHT